MTISAKPTNAQLDLIKRKRNWPHHNITLKHGMPFRYDARTIQEREISVDMTNNKPKSHHATDVPRDSDGAYRVVDRIDGKRWRGKGVWLDPIPHAHPKGRKHHEKV